MIAIRRTSVGAPGIVYFLKLKVIQRWVGVCWMYLNTQGSQIDRVIARIKAITL